MSWELASVLVLAAALAAGFGWYERQRPSARVVALVASLAALAVVGRLAFAAFPNVKPVTDIVLFAGYALGAAPGFAVGAITALVSNVFFSQGPWTAWQMAGWGGVGISGAALARVTRGRELGRLPLALVCAMAGLAFGLWMDLYQWTLAANQDLRSYLAVTTSSLPYNLAHATGNFVFCLVIGPAFVRALRRYRRRFTVRWQPAVAGSALLALVLAAGLTGAPSAHASASGRAVRYLEGAQNRDGGFGAARGQASSQLYSGWAGLGLAAARHNPRDVHRRRGRSIVTYLRRRAGGLRDTGELERTILVLTAAGSSPRRFAGRNLVAELLRRRGADGSWAGLVNHTAFGLLALRGAGLGGLAGSADFLERAQNGDGGFGFTASAASDADDTGAVLQALAAAGRGRGGAAQRAIAYLRGAQGADGGFGQLAGRGSNAQSTAWAVQGLQAASAGGDSVRRALAYLKGLQRRDGSIGYSRESAQTPVWVTGQALAALRLKPFPLAAVPRRHRPARRARVRRSRSRHARGSKAGARHTRRASPRRVHAAAPVRPSARVRSTAAAPEEGGPSPVLLAGVGLGGVVALGLARWLVRRRRRAAAG